MNAWLVFMCICLPVFTEAELRYNPPPPPTTTPPQCDLICILGCPEIDCKFGVGKLHPCDCCPVCAKGPGEECGGINNKFGKCGDELTCKTPSNPYSRGICVGLSDNQQTKITELILVNFVGNYAPSDPVNYERNSESDNDSREGNNGVPGNDGIPGSMCLDCTVVLCASPETLGCPDSFITDPCRCCPRCIRAYPF